MTSLLRLKLPLSTNFGNAKPSTRGLPCAKAKHIGSPSARNADFVVIQTHLFQVLLGQRFFGCTAEEAGRIFQCFSGFISDFGPSNQRLGRSIFFGPPLGTDEARAEREKIDLSLARLEGYAESGVWMEGPDLTAADIVTYRGLKLLLRAARRPEAASRFDRAGAIVCLIFKIRHPR